MTISEAIKSNERKDSRMVFMEKSFDERNRFILPKEITDALNMFPGDRFKIIPYDDGVFLEKVQKN